MSEMHDTENALARAVKAIYDASDLNREIQPLLAPLLDELISTTSATSVRDVLPEFHDWTIPTRVQLAMHVRILSLDGARPSDEAQLAQFLELFCEDMPEWAAALRAHSQVA